MHKMKIITDSTCDLSKELYEKYDISVMPLYVTIGGKTYQDGVDITTVELYKKVKQYNELPKSAAVSPLEFEEMFKKFIDQGQQILYVGIGSGFSATFNNARIAKESFEDGAITIVDSKNLSSGIGLLVLKACTLRDQGRSITEIATSLEAIVPKVRTQFAINTLDYLHKGGRCSGTARLFGTLLKVKPIIRVVDGAMNVAKKPRGTFERALSVLLDYVDDDIANIDRDFIMVTHSQASKDANYLIDELNKRNIANSIIETQASGTISTHCGPRTIGILYIVTK